MRRCPKCGARYFKDERFCPLDGSRLEERDETAPEVDRARERRLEDEFELLESLGRDELGEVFVAEDRSTHDRVAVKRFDAWTRESSRALERYAGTLQRLKSEPVDGIPLVISYHMAPDDAFLASELVEGGVTLQHFIQKVEAIDLEDAVEILLGVLDAVRQLHRLGIVHGGMTPRKILLTRGAERSGVYVTDPGQFELWRVDNPIQTSRRLPDRFLGIAQYYSPEAALGQDVTPSADIYTAGLIFYEALAGKPPFSAGSFATTLKRQIYERPLPPRLSRPGLDIPPAVESLIECALAKNVEGRFDSAEALSNALANLKMIVAEQVPSSSRLVGEEPPSSAEASVPPEITGQPTDQLRAAPESHPAEEAPIGDEVASEPEPEDEVELPRRRWRLKWPRRRKSKRDRFLDDEAEAPEEPLDERADGGETGEEPEDTRGESRETVLLPAARAMAKLSDRDEGQRARPPGDEPEGPVPAEVIEREWALLDVSLLEPPVTPDPEDEELAFGSGDDGAVETHEERDSLESAFDQIEAELFEAVGEGVPAGEPPGYHQAAEADEAVAAPEEEAAEAGEAAAAPLPDFDADLLATGGSDDAGMSTPPAGGAEPAPEPRVDPSVAGAQDIPLEGESESISGWFQAAPGDFRDTADEDVPFVDSRRWNLRFAGALVVFVGLVIGAVVVFSGRQARDGSESEEAVASAETASDEVSGPSAESETASQDRIELAQVERTEPDEGPAEAGEAQSGAVEQVAAAEPPSEMEIAASGSAAEEEQAAEPPGETETVASRSAAEEEQAAEPPSEPEVVVPEPEPEGAEPEPVVAEPEPVVAEPEPEAAEPAVEPVDVEESPTAVASSRERAEEGEREVSSASEEAEPAERRRERADEAETPPPAIAAVEEPTETEERPEPAIVVLPETETAEAAQESEPDESEPAAIVVEETEDSRSRSRDLAREAEDALDDTDYDQAEDLFRSAIEADDRNARAYAGLGDVFFQRRDFATARRYHRLAVTYAEHVADFHSKLGMDYFRLGRFEDAIESWERALELDSSAEDASRYIEIARERLAGQR